jgi:hypothetical protein
MWVVSRPGADVVFDWRLSRRHGELTGLIEGYQGILQSDGYGAIRRRGHDCARGSQQQQLFVLCQGCEAVAQGQAHVAGGDGGPARAPAQGAQAALPGASAYVFAGHRAQAAAPSALEKLPTAQGVQLALPATGAKVPRKQS